MDTKFLQDNDAAVAKLMQKLADLKTQLKDLIAATADLDEAKHNHTNAETALAIAVSDCAFLELNEADYMSGEVCA
jgi:hypothetical protein